jgi:hypothetical protein
MPKVHTLQPPPPPIPPAPEPYMCFIYLLLRYVKTNLQVELLKFRKYKKKSVFNTANGNRNI